MASLLYVVGSPRGERSVSTTIAGAYADAWRGRNPSARVDILDVWTEDIPEFGTEALAAKYAGLAGETLSAEQRKAWDALKAIAQRFHDADVVLIAAPMWNFGVPYKLKQLIDLVSQKDILFRFDETGFDGMLKGRKGVLALARGISYGPDEAVSEEEFDFQRRYLEMWLRFVGITEIEVIVAEKTLLGPEADAEARAAGIRRAKELGGA